MPDVDQLTIESAVHGPTGRPGCIMRWGTRSTALELDVVNATARELYAAASYAETDLGLMRLLRDDVRMELGAIGALLRDVRAARPTPEGKVALRVEYIVGANTDMPYVHIHRGSMEASLSPDAARLMADHWTAAAVAAGLDARLRYVLGEFDQLATADVDAIFTALRHTGRFAT